MRRIMAGAAGLLLSVTLLGACTSDDEESPQSGPNSSSATPSETRVPTSSSVGQVAGKLGKKKRRATLRSVTRSVDRWLDAAYVEGKYPRSNFNKAFPGFTRGATKLASKQPKIMSNAAVGKRVESVEVKRRKVTVDVLAPGGRTVGATARVVLVFRMSGDVERTDRVRGRVMLTPAGKGWKVFGFDVQRNVMKGGK